MTLSGYVYTIYNELLKAGWHMGEIDDMDMLGYLKIKAWALKKESTPPKPRKRYIDEIWPTDRK